MKASVLIRRGKLPAFGPAARAKIPVARGLVVALCCLGACSPEAPSRASDTHADDENVEGDDSSAEGDAPDDDHASSAPDAGVSNLRKDAGVEGKADAETRPRDTGAPQGDAAAPAEAAQGDAAAPQGDGGTKADAGTTGPSRKLPKCVTKDSQVLMIGDSYINWISHSFPEDIAALSEQTWRLEAIGGTSLATGGIGLIGLGYIPDQLEKAFAQDPDAHTVLMDGGGNDILVRDPFISPNSCTASGAAKDPNCQMIVSAALEAANKLMDRAASLGIRDVVYFFYPHVPALTILSDDNPNEILDYALPMAKDLCDSAEQRTGGKLRCTFVDMVPVFEGHPDYFNEDIHPNDTGSRAMAEEIWDVMTYKCVAQKGPKDCCEP